jgi:hypothetical protein
MQMGSSSKTVFGLKIAGIVLLLAFASLFFVPVEFRRLYLAVFDLLVVLTVIWIFPATWVALKLRAAAPKTVLALLIIFVGTPLLLWVVGLRWDLLVRVPARVKVNGSSIREARVYRSLNGETAVFLDNLDGPRVYVPSLRDVIDCDKTLFHDYRLLGRLEKGRDEYFCMTSEKEEIDLELVVTRQEISFNFPQGRTIRRLTVDF